MEVKVNTPCGRKLDWGSPGHLDKFWINKYYTVFLEQHLARTVGLLNILPYMPSISLLFSHLFFKDKDMRWGHAVVIPVTSPLYCLSLMCRVRSHYPLSKSPVFCLFVGSKIERDGGDIFDQLTLRFFRFDQVFYTKIPHTGDTNSLDRCG